MDFPQPVSPTTAMNSPGRARTDTSSRTSGPSGPYRNETCSKPIPPLSRADSASAGSGGGVSASTGCTWSSDGVSVATAWKEWPSRETAEKKAVDTP